ncbi:MAG: FKBP-type peptidyl-prolyl cis-trans isomerase N-terminal domain-containing protein [Sphaerochaeta sp.]|nr:FKBP-type peptidyl-prolyl cis-trans isomerase N-terminal domain-containing protein [Sphaerochaeta sp.]
MKKFFLVCIVPCIAVLSLASCDRSQEVPLVKAPTPVLVAEPSAPVIQTKTEIVLHDSIKDKPRPVSLDERFSYTYGYMLYSTLKQQGFDNLDSDFFAKGAIDAQQGSGFFSQDEMSKVLSEVQSKMLEIAQIEQNALASENLERAESFLALNKDQKGVKVTDSGLQYKVLTEGQGAKPTGEQMVELDYQIVLLNGRVVDSSYERGHSSRFQLKAIGVPGFVEGVKLMSEGSKYQFWIHPKLGYGKEGTQNIDPNTLLVVQVELKAVQSVP